MSHFSLEGEINALLDRLNLPIAVGEAVQICWDKSEPIYNTYTIHRGPPWTIYLTQGKMCRCHAMRTGTLMRNIKLSNITKEDQASRKHVVLARSQRTRPTRCPRGRRAAA